MVLVYKVLEDGEYPWLMNYDYENLIIRPPKNQVATLLLPLIYDCLRGAINMKDSYKERPTLHEFLHKIKSMYVWCLLKELNEVKAIEVMSNKGFPILRKRVQIKAQKDDEC